MSDFHKSIQKEMDRLKLLVPIVKKVHGKEHPELYAVGDIFNDLCEHLYTEEININQLIERAQRLSLLTNHFQPPKDACQAFQEIYKHLSFIVQRIYTIQKKEVLNE